jgi:hypothetical protein
MKKKIEMHSIQRKRMNTEVDQTKPVKKKLYVEGDDDDDEDKTTTI